MSRGPPTAISENTRGEGGRRGGYTDGTLVLLIGHVILSFSDLKIFFKYCTVLYMYTT